MHAGLLGAFRTGSAAAQTAAIRTCPLNLLFSSEPTWPSMLKSASEHARGRFQALVVSLDPLRLPQRRLHEQVGLERRPARGQSMAGDPA